MSNKTVIIYETKPIPECYGNFKLFCEVKGLNHNTYGRKKLPIKINGHKVHRVPRITKKYLEEQSRKSGTYKKK